MLSATRIRSKENGPLHPSNETGACVADTDHQNEMDKRHLSRELSPLTAASPQYLEELRERCLVRRDSHDAGWRDFFEFVEGLPDVARCEGSNVTAVNSGDLATETAHIDDPAIRAWLLAAIEGSTTPQTPESRVDILGQLVAAETFELFLASKFPGKKRFSAEGAETLIPLVLRFVETAAREGISRIVIGMMHRGRLNLLANVFREPLVDLLAKFEGRYPFDGENSQAADIPYHLGFETTLETSSGPVHIELLPNPSHLEAVNAVALGQVRACQDIEKQTGHSSTMRTVGLLIHTDASVVGQGSVAELLQMSGLAAYSTGGTVHFIVNNQIGFTTEPAEARTSLHCTGPWKAIDSAVFHVDGNDPDCGVRAVDVALAFRNRHGRDAVVDLVCYRRRGHNEADEPRFTQPLMYARIDAMPSVANLYARNLSCAGISAEPLVEERRRECLHELDAALAAARGSAWRPKPAAKRTRSAPAAEEHPDMQEPTTGVSEKRLRSLLKSLSSIPEGFNVGQKLGRIISQRAAAADVGLQWGLAETVAFATLLAEKHPIRLAGQDAVRGTFSQRHIVLTDVETGRGYVSLHHLAAEQAFIDAVNTPLSEYAVLGFEYGYSVARADALVIWEAQYGDFANGAQIIIDQFVVSAEEKWGQKSGLVMLLPHGLEGQGPEHSSARLERLLQLAAKENVEIAIPTTPANYFHLLRRQVLRQSRKPLFIATPKSILRNAAARSPLADFSEAQRFKALVTWRPAGKVKRVLLCSGKIAYDLEEACITKDLQDQAIVRIEMLYPFPAVELEATVQKWTHAVFVWVQEEPMNMGAWSFVKPRIERVLLDAGVASAQLSLISRPESPSPAGSFHAHNIEDQKRLVEAALYCREG
jgi:2-oxoglutarate dehydrogenase E1 component